MTRAAMRGSRPQVVADGAQDRQLGFDADLGELTERSDDVVEAAVVVHRDRDADFGCGHDVDRRAIPFEDLEHAPQEAVRHQHARGRDLDHGHVPLARDRRERTIGRRRLGGNRRAGGLSRGGCSGCEPGCPSPPPEESCSDAAPLRRSRRAPTPRRTRGAGRRAGFATTRGSAVSMPSTSVQIWISRASSAGADDGGRVVGPAASERRRHALRRSRRRIRQATGTRPSATRGTISRADRLARFGRPAARRRCARRR